MRLFAACRFVFTFAVLLQTMPGSGAAAAKSREDIFV
jgi:hypothetical protein